MKSLVKLTPWILFYTCLFSIFCIVLVGVIAYARGYRFNFQENKIVSTGILAISSNPKAAKIYINKELQGATNSNVTLPYGRYEVSVKKEGYSEWTKTIALKGETVMSLDARLFSKNPTLTPLTNISVSKALLLEDGQKIILISQKGDIETDGIYLFEPTNGTLSLFTPLTILLKKSLLPSDIDLNSLEVYSDSDLKQILAIFSSSEGPLIYLLSLEQENTELLQVTNSKEINIIKKWEEDKTAHTIKVLESLPKKIRSVALRSFVLVSLSPNQKKILYVAKNNDTLPLVIDPPLIGSNQVSEQRNLTKGDIYIYDEKEDKNYRQPGNIEKELLDSEIARIAEIEKTVQKSADTQEASSSSTEKPTYGLVTSQKITNQVKKNILWYPTSDYIVLKELNQISLMQYDGENKQVVYAGPFDQNFFAISSDGNLLVIVDLNPGNNQFGDLYSIGLE